MRLTPLPPSFLSLDVSFMLCDGYDRCEVMSSAVTSPLLCCLDYGVEWSVPHLHSCGTPLLPTRHNPRYSLINSSPLPL